MTCYARSRVQTMQFTAMKFLLTFVVGFVVMQPGKLIVLAS